jgi:hypothetical protein
MDIERIKSRGSAKERPYKNSKGQYVLGNPSKGTDWHHARNQICVETIEEAAHHIEANFLSIRMFAPGLRPSMVQHNHVRVIRP